MTKRTCFFIMMGFMLISRHALATEQQGPEGVLRDPFESSFLTDKERDSGSFSNKQASSLEFWKQQYVFQQQTEAVEPIHLHAFTLYHANAQQLATLIQSQKHQLLSPRGAIWADERTNQLMVHDSDTRGQKILDVIRLLDVPVKQIRIESRIVFANAEFEQELGLQLHTVDATPHYDSSPHRTRELNSMNLLGTPGYHKPNNESQMNFTLARLPSGTLLDLELLALENQGLGKTIASPHLITSHQQKAYIESGEEIPYQETSANGATSVRFKKAVLRLEVVPHVMLNHDIMLDLKVNQDARGAVTAGVPAINTRQMQTRVRIKDGETIVLGGIYQQMKTQQVKQVPFLGQWPIIGWLFKNKIETCQKLKLLIFVTPHIISDEQLTPAPLSQKNNSDSIELAANDILESRS